MLNHQRAMNIELSDVQWGIILLQTQKRTYESIGDCSIDTQYLHIHRALVLLDVSALLPISVWTDVIRFCVLSVYEPISIWGNNVNLVSCIKYYWWDQCLLLSMERTIILFLLYFIVNKFIFSFSSLWWRLKGICIVFY